MDETYASNVDNLNELARQYKQGELDKAEVMKQNVIDKFNDKLEGYSDKWKAVQEGGQDELATQFGLKGAYKGAKKVYDLYKKYKNSKTGEDTEDTPEELEDPEAEAKVDAGDAPEAPEAPDNFSEFRAGQADRFQQRLGELGEEPEPPAAEQELVTPENVKTLQGEGDTSAPEGDTSPAETAEETPTQTVEEGPGQTSGIENATADATQSSENIAGDAVAKTGENVGKDVAETAAETAGEEVGGEAAGEAIGATVLSAVPVVGEVALAVGGLVALGEGLYHLFHHPHKPKVYTPVQASLVPQSVSQKYANALPSFDSSSDNMPSDAVF